MTVVYLDRVVLQEDVTGLEEVQVIAYGSQKKRTLVSAVSSVKADDKRSFRRIVWRIFYKDTWQAWKLITFPVLRVVAVPLLPFGDIIPFLPGMVRVVVRKVKTEPTEHLCT